MGFLVLLPLVGAVGPEGAVGPTQDPGVADAAMRGADRETMVELIRQGADVNASQGDGMTALHWAATRGDLPLTELLVDAGARLEPTTRLGRYTPLHVAALEGHGAVVGALLEAGANPHARTSSGGATPLHLAAGAGTTDGVRFLMDHGADMNAREELRGQTPLMFAAALGRTGVLHLLLERGADAALLSEVSDVRRLEMEDRRARMVRDSILAAFRPTSENGEVWIPSPSQVQAAARTAREFLANGAEDFSVDEDASGEEEASEDEDASEEEDAAVEEDDTYDPGWTARIGARGGMSALLYAARDGHRTAAMALLDRGADINQVGGGDETSPLLMAAINGHFDLARELLVRGADPNLRNTSGDSPLYGTIETRWAPRVMMPQQHAWMEQETTHI
ncbi:MAG: ankyrin repeat domain-containing protein, partial [Gemmatimonadales bacterium]